MAQDIVRVLLLAVAVLLLITVNYSTGFKWIPLKSGDTIPLNAMSLHEGSKKFVGRARHYDEILPAEVNSSFAVVESCSQRVVKHQYEILVSQENCRWQMLPAIENIPLNIVRVGTAANGEPTYVGKTVTNAFRRIESLYLGVSSRAKNRIASYEGWILLCDDNSFWIDTAASNIPNNTIYGGLSEEENHMYVARLKSECSIIPGLVLPDLGIAMAVYNKRTIHSKYCQVLLGAPDEYRWVPSADGNIPDYAVVSSKERTGELMYVAVVEQTVGYIISSIAAKMNTTYKILVKNVL